MGQIYERDALLDPVKSSRFARLKNGAAQRKFLLFDHRSAPKAR
jgi:hypothetical protein